MTREQYAEATQKLLSQLLQRLNTQDKKIESIDKDLGAKFANL